MENVEARTGSQTSASTVRVLVVAAVAVVLGGAIFVLARRLEWTLGEIYLGIFVPSVAINLACMTLWNPVLFERRLFPGKGTKAWDIVWLVFNMPVWMAVFAVVPDGSPLLDDSEAVVFQ